MHVLFGTVLALNDQALGLISGVVIVTLVTLLVFWRALIAECMDPLFLRSVSGLSSPVHFLFLGLVVVNLVAGFLALGTLLAVGLMILPGAAARFWTTRVTGMVFLAVGIGMAASLSGLLLSYHLAAPSGPAIILCAGLAYLGSLLLGQRGLIRTLAKPQAHRTA
jgi:zinc/manganese transport system permease protein